MNLKRFRTIKSSLADLWTAAWILANSCNFINFSIIHEQPGGCQFHEGIIIFHLFYKLHTASITISNSLILRGVCSNSMTTTTTGKERKSFHSLALNKSWNHPEDQGYIYHHTKKQLQIQHLGTRIYIFCNLKKYANLHV